MIRTLALAFLVACTTDAPPGSGDTGDTGTAGDTGGTGETGDTGTWNPTGNLCGTVSRPNSAPEGGTVYVATVADGETACRGGDTGAAGWWGETVAEPILHGPHFEATLPLGSYGVEVVAPDDYGACKAIEITDTEVCAHEVSLYLDYDEPVDKPNVYLYPESASLVTVKIPAWRNITASDPQYPVEGWRVRAFPDGRLATAAGPRDFLFYELLWDPTRFQTEAGWCVPGEIAQATIEDAMADLGFLPNEIGDFASGWDENFPEAEWMTVYPQSELSILRIEPEPETLLRTWFYVVEGCQAAAAPELHSTPRVGWHAAEWGVSFGRPLDRGELLVEGWR